MQRTSKRYTWKPHMQWFSKSDNNFLGNYLNRLPNYVTDEDSLRAQKPLQPLLCSCSPSMPLAHFLSNVSPEQMVQVMLRSQLLRGALSTLRDQNGFLVYEILVARRISALVDLLGQLETTEAISILQTQNFARKEPLVITMVLALPESLRSLLLVKPELYRPLLSIHGANSFSVFHFLALPGSILDKILLDMQEDDAQVVLSDVNHESGLSLACHMSAQCPDQFAHVVVQRAKVRSVLRSFSCAKGLTPYHIMAGINGLELLEMLRCLDSNDRAAILEAESSQGYPVALMLASAKAPVFKRLVKELSDLRPVLLRLHDTDGRLAYHVCLENGSDSDLQELLLQIEEVDALSVLKSPNMLNGMPLAHTYSEKHPNGLAALCMQRHCIMEALLHVSDSDGWLPYHLMAKQHIGSFLNFLSQLGDEGAIQILMAPNSKTRETVAITMAKQNPSVLDNLVHQHPGWRTSLLAMQDEDGRMLHAVGEVSGSQYIFHLNAQGRAGTLNLSRLMSFVRFPIMTGREISPKQLQHLLAVSKVNEEAYIASISSYTEAQRSDIMRLLATVHELMGVGDTSELGDLKGRIPINSLQIIADEVHCVLSDVRCFPDHFQSLLDICHYSGLHTQRDESVLLLLIRELWRFCTVDLRSGIMSLISRRVFGSCPDSVSTHADNCIVHALDKLYGLYGGNTVEDVFCPSPNVLCCLVHEIAQEILVLPNLEPIIQCVVERSSGSDKWSVIRLLIGEEAALNCSKTNEDSFDSALFCLDKVQRLSLTQAGVHHLIGHFGLFHGKHEDTGNKCQIPLSVEAEMVFQIFQKIVIKEEKISSDDWGVCHKFQTQLTKSGDFKLKNFLRMNHSIEDIACCHVDWTASPTDGYIMWKCTVLGASNNVKLISFVQPKQFKLIFTSGESLLSPVQSFRSVLHFLAENNHVMLEELAISLEQSVFLSQASSSSGELWQHVLARNNPACLFRILRQQDPELASRVFAAVNKNTSEPLAMMIARNFSRSCFLEMVKFPALIHAFLALTELDKPCERWGPVFSLAMYHSDLFGELLVHVEDGIAVELLSTRHPEHKIRAAHIMAQVNPKCFASLVVKKSVLSRSKFATHGSLAFALLSLASKDGWHPYHYMVNALQNNLIHFRWMIKHLTIKEAFSIITAENRFFRFLNAWSTSISLFVFFCAEKKLFPIFGSQIGPFSLMTSFAGSVVVRNLGGIVCILCARGLSWFLSSGITYQGQLSNIATAAASVLCQKLNLSLRWHVLSTLIAAMPVAAFGLSFVDCGHVRAELLLAVLPQLGQAMALHVIADFFTGIRRSLAMMSTWPLIQDPRVLILWEHHKPVVLFSVAILETVSSVIASVWTARDIFAVTLVMEARLADESGVDDLEARVQQNDARENDAVAQEEGNLNLQ